MKPKKLCCAAAVILAACLTGSVSAQTYNWTAGGDATTWSQGANWLGGVAPVAPTPPAFQIFIGTGYPTTTPTPITIGALDVVQLTDSLFGPEWGETLNIYGTVRAGFGFFPIGDNTTGTSFINLYGNGSLAANDTVSIGDAWWFPGGPNVVMNLRDSSLVSANYLWLGGHVNLYGGMVSVTNFMGTGTSGGPVFAGGIDSDATRFVNLVNGKLVLPAGFTANVNNWITRGILFAYGKKLQSTDVVINESDVNFPGRTVVSTIPLGGSLITVHPAARTNMMVGTFQQVALLGDYPGVVNVDLSYLDPTTVPAPTFVSSAPGVVSVTTGGHAVALSVGSATITATSGVLSSNILIVVTPFTNSLIHDYKFSETSGTTAADSVPGNSPTWDGTLNGGATFGGGQVTLDGSSGFVQLPAGIVSSMDAVTVEGWASFGPASAWATLFDFGDQDGLISPQGMNYIGFQPFTGATVPGAAVLYGRGDPGNGDDQGTAYSLVGGGVTNYLGNVHVVCVFHPYAGYVALYTNGVLAAINNNVSSPLASTLGSDPLNFLGQSLYASDPFLNASIDEFRIYNGPLSAAQIMADHALGPNQLIGTSTHVSLHAALSGGNLVVTWPTTSALVDLMSSPVLGAGASWTSVGGPLTVVGGNYQMTIPVTGSARFFRLQQY